MTTDQTPERFVLNPVRTLTEDERALLTHISRWGSSGYPVYRLKNSWTWGPWRSVEGPRVVFRTKREATTSFEAYFDLLRDCSAFEAWQKARSA